MDDGRRGISRLGRGSGGGSIAEGLLNLIALILVDPCFCLALAASEYITYGRLRKRCHLPFFLPVTVDQPQ